MSIYLKTNKLNRNKLIYNPNKINKNILSNYINISTTDKLLNKNASTDRALYTTKDPYYNGIGQFVRNSSCWLNGITNISCFSPAQLSGATWSQRGGTLITKKHILLAKHFQISILPNGGTPIIFVDENNNVIRRNLISYAYDDSDLAIGLLDNEVPSNIKIAKVLPTNFTNYIAGSFGIDMGYDLSPLLYAVGMDQEQKANLKLFYNVFKYTTNLIASGYAFLAYVSDFNVSPAAYATMNPQPTEFSSFNEPTVTGDSGQPSFLIINNELVLLTTWWGPTNGPFVTFKYELINSLINTLSPNQGYSLTPIDLLSVYNNI
jgi:hypothetical protein